MMHLQPEAHQVLLTAGDVQKLEAEAAQLAAEIEEMETRRRLLEERRAEVSARLNKIRELLQALGLVDRLSPSKSASVETTSENNSSSDANLEKDETRGVWIPEVIRALKTGVYESMTSAELRQAVEAGEYGNMLKVSDKGYYHAIRRLALRGEITKAHNRLFLASGLARYEKDVASGANVESFGPPVRKGSAMADKIMGHIAESGGRATAGDIIECLLRDERFKGPVGRNRSSGYNVLVRLVRQELLVRDGNGVYSIPEKDQASAEAEA